MAGGVAVLIVEIVVMVVLKGMTILKIMEPKVTPVIIMMMRLVTVMVAMVVMMPVTLLMQTKVKMLMMTVTMAELMTLRLHENTVS